jgi:seryl-tRNA synthetase
MTDAENVERFRGELAARGLLIPAGVDGLYARGREFERVVDAFDRLFTAAVAQDGAESLRFPPVISRRDFETSGYLKSFPHLAGSVFGFDGGQAEHQRMLEKVERREDWSEFQRMADVVLTSAACYPVYPMLAGTLPPAGRFVDVYSYCFRREPSKDPARMQMFRMRELVRIGEPEDLQPWREAWIARGTRILESVGLQPKTAPASDPFFGRGGKMLALNQIEQSLKYELLVPVASEENPTAVMSFNYHQDHFGDVFGIRTSAGRVAHTACIAFGIERIALALFKAHGFSTAQWAPHVRAKLWPE